MSMPCRNQFAALATAAFVVLVDTLTPNAAYAETKLREVSVDFMDRGITTPNSPLTVTGDGNRYTNVKGGAVYIPLKIHAQMNNVSLSYKIFSSRLYPNPGGGGKPTNFVETLAYNYAARKIDEHENFPFVFGSNHRVGENAIAACNDLIQQGASKTERHETSLNLPMLYLVKAGKEKGLFQFDSGGTGVPPHQNPENYTQRTERTAETVAQLRVLCEPLSKTPTDDLAFEHGKMRVTDVKLFLTTYANHNSRPNPATSCPKLKVTARFVTNQKGLVHFDLSHKVGDQPLKTVPITIESKHKGDGTFEAEYENWWSVSKTSYAQFMVQETEGLGLSAGWKDITLYCTSPGGGGFANPDTNDLDQPELKVLKSAINVSAVEGNTPTGCPATAYVDLEFITNKKGSVPFRVTATDGSVINSSVGAEEEQGPLLIGPDQQQYATTYRAKFRRTLTIEKATDRDYSVEVRNVAVLPEAKTAGPDNLKVDCRGTFTSPFDVSGTKLDIISLPGKCPKKAFVTANFTTVGAGEFPYVVGCTGGASASGKLQSEKVGNTYRARHVLTVDITKSQKLVCHARAHGYSGTAVFETRHFNCEGIRPDGDVTADTPTTHSDPEPGKPDVVHPVVVTPPPLPTKPTCAGGTLALITSKPPKYRCVCPARHDLKRSGPNAYRCVSTMADVPDAPVKIGCAGGVLRSNACVCPRGTAKRHMGPNRFLCHRTAEVPKRVLTPTFRSPSEKATAPAGKRIQPIQLRAAGTKVRR